MSFLLAAAALSRIVLAHDRNEADLETLGEAYIVSLLARSALGYGGFIAQDLALPSLA